MSGICIRDRHVVSHGHGVLERLVVERERFDGRRQSLAREVYDPGDGAAILLYNPSRSRVVLVRQFRLPAYLRDRQESLLEVCAGRLEGEDPERWIIKEARKKPDLPCKIPAAFSRPI
jgi:GDP-mannose pyrophosphatase NudK